MDIKDFHPTEVYKKQVNWTCNEEKNTFEQGEILECRLCSTAPRLKTYGYKTPKGWRQVWEYDVPDILRECYTLNLLFIPDEMEVGEFGGSFYFQGRLRAKMCISKDRHDAFLYALKAVGKQLRLLGHAFKKSPYKA